MTDKDKELTIQLACSALQAMSQMRSAAISRPLSGDDILHIVKDCQSAVLFLSKEEGV